MLLGALLATVGWAHFAVADETHPGERILIGEIASNCGNDEDGYRAIMGRLRQLGATVEATGLGKMDCSGPACAVKLRNEPGYLLGGDIRVGQTSLWIVDLAKDQILVQRHIGRGVDDPSSLARQAASLVEGLHDPLARWTPRTQVLACAASPMTHNPALVTAAIPVDASTDPRIVLAVHAPPSIEKYAADFQKNVRRSLGEMGLQVREVRGIAPPANPRDALSAALKDLPLVDVQLLAPQQDKKHLTPDGAIVRLSDGQRAIQASIECATQDCEPSQLVRFVKRNAVALLDHADGAGVPLGGAPPSDVCIPPALPCAAASPAQSIPLVDSASGSAMTMREPPISSAPDMSKHRGLYLGLGGGLIGVMALGLVVSGAMYAQNGQPKMFGTCDYMGNRDPACIWQTSAGATAGFVLSPVAGIAGGFFLWKGLSLPRSSLRETK